jgi:uncharacterized protein RhaS with RHS repeats
LDQETNLAYNRYHYYSPESGAYVSQDPVGLEGEMPNMYSYVKESNVRTDPFGLGEVIHFPDFDSAREAAFEMASGGDPNVTFTPTKIDPVTGTEVEFKGSNGSKVAYDSAHADMDASLGHDKPHVGVQQGGKRGKRGAKRANLTFDGPTHPHRSPIKGQGCL